ncbi:patatin-like phospholipase family protein [Streptomyces sp. GSL17-111]|uniref:patatin-like phospholipase family protein n=1 Tax=Streptomyces sp. GSL17-111 TaxID=3121596 RepID=UPI0030F3D4E4
MGRTALVLGGGGMTGIGWETGLLAGLAEAGCDVSDADVVIGTSAGSLVGAQITSGLCTLDELYARQLGPAARPRPQPRGPGRPAATSPPQPPAGAEGQRHAARVGPVTLGRFALAFRRSRSAADLGVRLGRIALAARTHDVADQRTVIGKRLPSHTWPQRRLLVTAVDAESGAFRAFDADAGAELVDAVTASCAVPGVWPPVAIGGRRWMDGGARSLVNADLAEGCERVIVLAPMHRAVGPMPTLRDQVAGLRAAGTQVAVVIPDAAARAAFGRNPLDPGRRAPAARAGRAQAAASVDAVAAVWRT